MQCTPDDSGGFRRLPVLSLGGEYPNLGCWWEGLEGSAREDVGASVRDGSGARGPWAVRRKSSRTGVG